MAGQQEPEVDGHAVSAGRKQRADSKWGRATKPRDLSLVTLFSSKTQPPKNSITSLNRPQLGTQGANMSQGDGEGGFSHSKHHT